MTNKQELNEKELNQVSGGKTYEEYSNEFSHRIDKYETENHIGEEVFIFESNAAWVVGTLLRSYEKSYTCCTRRTATVDIKEGHYHKPGKEDICLDYASIFIR